MDRSSVDAVTLRESRYKGFLRGGHLSHLRLKRGSKVFLGLKDHFPQTPKSARKVTWTRNWVTSVPPVAPHPLSGGVLGTAGGEEDLLLCLPVVVYYVSPEPYLEDPLLLRVVNKGLLCGTDYR